MRSSLPLTCLALAGVSIGNPIAKAQPQTYSVTSVVLSPPEDLSIEVQASIGIRKGVRSRTDLRYQHLSDFDQQRERPAALYRASERLDEIAEWVRQDDADEAKAQVQEVVELFEAHLPFVRRAHLADAYMLKALATCLDRARQTECVRQLEYVITFRENFFFDPDRYPERFRELFEETRERLREEGVRGSLEVSTDPPGAEVFVDGKSYGFSPAVAEGLLVGGHYITVKAPGYEEVVQRTAVDASYQVAVEIPIYRADRSDLWRQHLPDVRQELGAQRAGSSLRALANVLTTSQLVVCVVDPTPAGTHEVSLYLYHNRTAFLMAERRGRVAADADFVEVLQELTVDLFSGVDLSGQIEAPEEAPLSEEGEPIWHKWWFWAAVGVVAVSGTVAGIALSSSEESDVPDGFTRFEGVIR